jgi:hypothetical protein
MLKMENFRSYHDIKRQRFRDMYEARRSILQFNREWTTPLEDVYLAYDDQDRGKDESLPDIFHLMDSVIFMILATNQDNEISQGYRKNEIQSILDKNGLETLLSQISDQEARELRIDLEILEFISPDITKPWLKY